MAKKREWQKKKKPMGVEPFDVRKAEAHRRGIAEYGRPYRVYRENPIMHNKYTDMFEKWLATQFYEDPTPGPVKRRGGRKAVNKKRRSKIMQGYKAGGKV